MVEPSPKATTRTRFGPGVIVAAAFIGPGTIVTASMAGANYGLGLVWTVLTATLGAIVLQSLAARLGILSGDGLGAYLRNWLHQTRWYPWLACLVVLALGVGNAAYQAGNLTGASQGLVGAWGGTQELWLGALVLVTALLLCLGSFRWLQRILIGLVLLLSLCFLWTAWLQFPPAQAWLNSLMQPEFSAESLGVALAMIGTTIVPYNLFLHAKSAATNWEGVETEQALHEADWDSILAISLGGLVTMAVVVAARGAFYGETNGERMPLAEISQQLEPIAGRLSGLLFNAGLFAAGLTSSITAPLAAGFAISGLFGWTGREGSRRQVAVALLILLIGASFAFAAGKSPAQLILIAQIANGLLLPLIACIVLLAAARAQGKSGVSQLSLERKVAGAVVVLLVTGLALWKLLG